MEGKKSLVIRSGSLRMGGIERVLMEVLNNLNQKKYNISLIIEDNSGEENIFIKDIPNYVELYFLKSKEMIEKTHYHRTRKKNIYNKIMYNYLMAKEHSYVKNETKNVLKKIKTKHGSVDVFLDYDWGARRYVEDLEAKKKIVWIHNSIPKLLKKESKIKRFGKNLDKYDKVVAICDDMKNEMEKIYPYLQGKIERVYNPFNFNRILSLAEDTSELNEHQKELIDKNYVVAVSRLDMVQKDFRTLILGFKNAVERGIKENLYIIGDGPDKDKISILIKENNLQNRVYLIGRMSNPYIWMKKSQIFVHSSNYEGLPTVLIEAMICGKVVVSSDCPTGPFEILKGGECGVLFEVGDYKTLGKELVTLLNNYDLKKEYEEKLETRVLEFKSDIVIKEYEVVIDE